jgi:hypothetical protein
MAWRGLKWNRLEYLHKESRYGGEPGDPPIPFLDGVRRYLDSEGIPIGETGEHLRAIILGARREILEAIDGFRIGHTKADAISCELGISRAVAAKGLAIKQIGIMPFRYILHPQWTLYDNGVWSLLQGWTDRSVPLSMIWVMRNSIQHLRKLITGTPCHWETLAVEMTDQSVSKQEARTT